MEYFLDKECGLPEKRSFCLSGDRQRDSAIVGPDELFNSIMIYTYLE